MLKYERLTDLLDYDEETGEFTWNVRHGKAQPGEPAGYLHRSGAYVIAIDGAKYRAPRLAWFYATGDWPRGHVRPLNGDPTDTRFANLRDTLDPDDDSPAAHRARARLETKKAQQAVIQSNYAFGQSSVPGVRRSDGSGKWLALDPKNHSYERGRFDTPEEAEAFQRRFQAVLDVIDKHQPGVRANDRHVTAGPSGMTLETARYAYYYDPKAGQIYYRLGKAVGWPATKVNKAGRLVVSHGPRQYPAAHLAWFITHGHWAPIKGILHRNRNAHDIRLANLSLRTPTHKEPAQ